MKVIKRDGSEVPFDGQKIWKAIMKADAAGREAGIDALGTVDITELTEAVTQGCERLSRAPNVEEIQDMVEDALIETGHPKLMQLYKNYRTMRALNRKGNTTDERILSLLQRQNEEALQENSNKTL